MNLEKIIVNGILVLIFTIPATLAYGFMSAFGLIGWAVGLILAILLNGYIFGNFWKK